MESELKTVMVELRYWSCLNPNHRHKTKQIADACIKKEQEKVKPRRWTDAMYAEVKVKRDSGMTFKAIGDSIGVTTQRARMICWKAERLHNQTQS